jgi:hypothetical protein
MSSGLGIENVARSGPDLNVGVEKWNDVAFADSLMRNDDK